MSLTHVTSSTQGWLAMCDSKDHGPAGHADHIVGGPFTSKEDAENQCDYHVTRNHLSLGSFSAVMAGRMESWSDEIERIKQRMEPVRADDLDAVLDWSSLDRIVCVMRDTVRTWNEINQSGR